MPKTILKSAEPLWNLTMLAFVKLGIRIVIAFLSSSYWLFKTDPPVLGVLHFICLKKRNIQMLIFSIFIKIIELLISFNVVHLIFFFSFIKCIFF